jgi:redox-sensitive bicupin YhaK (pirin superfamily)
MATLEERSMIEQTVAARRVALGDLEVGRILPHATRRMVGPFVFLDHFGPATLPAGLPASADVRPHPHIGLSTVTYLFEGEIMHRDSVGSEQAIRPGELNWMTAGRGITHSERFEKARSRGDRLHGLQAWVALPTEMEETAPAFAHHAAAELPTVEERGVWMRLVAGEAYGMTTPVAVHSPTFYVHCELETGSSIELPREHAERAVYVATGLVEIGGRTIEPGRLVVLSSGTDARVVALGPSVVMMLGGAPLGPRHLEWNFVSSSRERIEQAKADWIAGRMKLPDLDNGEFIPLPG